MTNAWTESTKCGLEHKKPLLKLERRNEEETRSKLQTLQRKRSSMVVEATNLRTTHPTAKLERPNYLTRTVQNTEQSVGSCIPT